MDYTPYPGYSQTIGYAKSYAEIIGGWSQLVVGMSCMGPPELSDFTPLDDVVKLAAYAP
jgi:hypothetical protein